MRTKPLITLLVLAIVLVSAAVSLNRRDAVAPPAEVGRLLLPDLPVNEIARLSLAGVGSTATVEKVDGIWTVREKAGYPANFERLREIVIRLSEIKIGDVVRDGPQARNAAGLEATAAQADTVRLTFADAGGRDLGGLVLGNMHMRKAPADGTPYGGGAYPDGRYVAPLGGDGAYRVKDTLSELVSQPMPWLNTEILNIEEGQLQRITLAGPGHEPLVLERGADDVLNLVGTLGEDEEPNPSALSSIRSALAYLSFQDVARAAEAADSGTNAVSTFTAEARDGRVFSLTIGEPAAAGTREVRVAVSYVPPPVDGSDTNAPAINLASDVATLHARLSPWVFLVPTYKTDAMTTTRAGAVQAKQPPAAGSTDDSPPAGSDNGEPAAFPGLPEVATDPAPPPVTEAQPEETTAEGSHE